MRPRDSIWKISFFLLLVCLLAAFPVDALRLLPLGAGLLIRFVRHGSTLDKRSALDNALIFLLISGNRAIGLFFNHLMKGMVKSLGFFLSVADGVRAIGKVSDFD